MAGNANGNGWANGSEWEGRTGDSWAVEWRRTDRSFGGLTEQLLRRARDLEFAQVLDIGCGAGELSLAIARARHDAQVIGVDISPQLVEVARQRGANLANATFELGDAARWQPEAGFAPDFLMSRHGVMFFPDPVGAFTHINRVSAPGARMLFSCFRGPDVNEIYAGIRNLIPPPAEKPHPHDPGPLAFADPDRVRSILHASGWTKVDFEPCDFAMVAGVGENPVEDALGYFSAIGPIAVALAEMSRPDREALRDRLRAYATQREIDGIVAFAAGAWIVSAVRE